MIKLLTVIGTRPQIIKAGAMHRSIQNHFSQQLKEIYLHTGQHYDHNMSQGISDELVLPAPKYQLDIGSASHGEQTGRMIMGIEDAINEESPDALLVYGDTNSTLAAAVAASKVHLPILHVEAGLRSFNKGMPEEVNRIMCDHVSTMLFAPTQTAVDNLRREGFRCENQGRAHVDNPHVVHTGDVMYDNFLHLSRQMDKDILTQLGLEEGGFYLATVHRDHNTDDRTNLKHILDSFSQVASETGIPLLAPLHPRTQKMIKLEFDQAYLDSLKASGVMIVEPVAYREMNVLLNTCKMVFTDSGGLQKEAFFAKKPCVVLRPQTEWVELLEAGTAMLASASKENILRCWKELENEEHEYPPLYGEGDAAGEICKYILENL